MGGLGVGRSGDRRSRVSTCGSIGEEYLWSHRPAVFIFNHQSGLDAVLILKMLRRDLTGVGKKEILRNPIFGPLFAAAGIVFVDRANTSKAVRALEPAVEALREGRSLAIAPEGRGPRPRRAGPRSPRSTPPGCPRPTRPSSPPPPQNTRPHETPKWLGPSDWAQRTCWSSVGVHPRGVGWPS